MMTTLLTLMNGMNGNTIKVAGLRPHGRRSIINRLCLGVYMKHVHIYWDQGGMFGKSKCVLTTKKVRETSDDSNIYSYYIGRMDEYWIRNLIAVFDTQFKCNTSIEKISG